MDTQGALRARWSAQLLGGSGLTPTQVVDRAVALQGQDLPAVLRAIALRSAPGTTIADVRGAFDRGELVRSWPMRGTLFATTPAHLAALLGLTAERIRAQTARRRQQLGLDEGVLARARGILEPALAERPRTRAELLALWQADGIDTSAGRGYHLLFHHAVGGLAHWGAFAGDEQLFTATAAPAPAGDDALVDIARRYVAARGPVTEADLAWWLKLPKTQVRRAAASADLEVVDVGGAPHVASAPADPGDTGVTLVPGFDEWILGYADRALTASPAAQAALVPGGNGVFRPAVLLDGRVVGTWRGRAAGRPDPSLELVERVGAEDRRRIEAALAAWPHG
ncbi:winged helix DNA-binding domain-containing protein [Microbacterium excoecariae]|uniref:winged helix DNA-binding domain-containing protein n=1 Tax=Microbacterium excoecariae TaxID=2715210 RepID=UPI00140B85E9|nr:winged helix DNA-binding domain-containing protein [Microbacterium excoecariae]NHI16109.1 winged helix DNA-binding domain-containing protein [Microbacterium excoecariae]